MAEERHIGIGPEPAYGTRDLLTATAAAALMTATRNVSGPSKIKVVVAAGTTGSGSVVVPVTINGATINLTYTFAANGTVLIPDTFSAQPIVTAIDTSTDAITTSGLDGEAAVPTVQILTTPHTFYDFVDDSIEMDNTVVDDMDAAAEPWSTEHTPTSMNLGGSITLHVNPRNIGMLLRSCFGGVTTTPLSGLTLLASTTVLASHSVTTQPAGGAKPIRVELVDNGGGSTGTVTVNGPVNGSGDSEVLTFTGAAVKFTTKAFDSIDASGIVTSGLAAEGPPSDITVNQVDAFSHDFQPQRTNNSIHLDVAKAGQYTGEDTGHKIKQLKWTFALAKILDTALTVVGRERKQIAADTTVIVDRLRSFVFNNATVKFKGALDGTVRGGALSFIDTYDEGDYTMDGTRLRRSLRLETVKTDLALSIQMNDTTWIERFFGDDGDTTLQDALTDIPIEVLFTSPEDIYSETSPVVASQKYTLTFDIPRAVVEKYGVPQQGRGRDIINAVFRLREGANGFPCRVILVNDIPGY